MFIVTLLHFKLISILKFRTTCILKQFTLCIRVFATSGFVQISNVSFRLCGFKMAEIVLFHTDLYYNGFDCI
jgi:hypothetical protein